MAHEPIWTGEVRAGRVIYDRPADFVNWLSTLNGKRVVVRVEPRKVRRSVEQNAYWWGVVVPIIAEDLGWDRHEHDALHYSLLHECFGYTEKNGLRVPIKTASSKLSVDEFTQLIEWAVRWAAVEHHIVVPLPNEV